MEAIITLLNDFISGKIAAETFAVAYIQFWREIRDEQDEMEAAQGLREERIKVQKDLTSGLISKEEFARAWSQIDEEVMGSRVKPGSREAEIISHMMVEANAYEGDPEFRTAYQIGEEELRNEARKALEELSRIKK